MFVTYIQKAGCRLVWLEEHKATNRVLFVSTCWFINDYELLLKGRHKLQ